MVQIGQSNFPITDHCAFDRAEASKHISSAIIEPSVLTEEILNVFMTFYAEIIVATLQASIAKEAIQSDTKIARRGGKWYS